MKTILIVFAGILSCAPSFGRQTSIFSEGGIRNEMLASTPYKALQLNKSILFMDRPLLQTEKQFSIWGSGGTYGAGKESALLSLAVPGLGLWRATKNPLMLAFAPVCYGFVTYGTFKMIKSRKEGGDAYDLYLAEKNPELQATYLTDVESAIDGSKWGGTVVGVGAALWVFQTAWTFIYGNYNDKYRARDAKWKNATSFYGGYDYGTKTATLNMNFKF